MPLTRKSIRKKRRRLVHAVKRNKVKLLKDLLNSPKWYNTTDKNGQNLLQIAICEEKKEVFNYLLSLPDYPLEFTNRSGKTALEMSLTIQLGVMREYFACKLIKKGARIDKMYKGDTLLHRACLKGYVKASLLLIQKGIDVNACGYRNDTPLLMICRETCCDYIKRTEIILMLLEFGADTSVTDKNGYTPFENSVVWAVSNEAQNALFYYSYDEFSLLEIHLEILLRLAEKNSFLFQEISKRHLKIIDTNESYVKYFLSYLFFINATNLRILFTKFATYLKTFFTQPLYITFDVPTTIVSIEKLNVLIESRLKDEIINFFIPLTRLCIHSGLCHIQNQSKITEVILYLLSYGLEMDESILNLIYKYFGYCDLFKTLLHMNIKKKPDFCFEFVLPRLLINVNQTLEEFLKNNKITRSNHLKELMRYFAHPKLYSMYRKKNPEENINDPQVPSLLELSRNVFKSYFIKKFQIKTISQFCTHLNCLEICPDYKQVITYETDLYSI